MKLTCIITATEVGGAETMLLRLLTHLSADVEPEVVSLAPIGTIGEELLRAGIPVSSPRMRPGVPNPAGVAWCVSHLRRVKPDLVHTWMYHADLVGGIAARLAGVRRVVWGIHNSRLSPERSKRGTRMVMRANALLSGHVPDRILCCSEAARDVHVEAGYAASKMVVIPNGIEVTRFVPSPDARRAVRAELGLPAGASIVGLIGRWNPDKNHLGFLSAAATVHARRPDVHFLLAGLGVDAANATLQSALERSPVQRVVHLLGLRHDVPSLMAGLDVLASSSHSEAFPVVLGEAMASGVPCAVTDVGDSAYILGDTGRVVPEGDMVGLGNAIVSLLELPATDRNLLGEQARRRVTANFELGAIVRRHEALYRTLLASKDSPANP